MFHAQFVVHRLRCEMDYGSCSQHTPQYLARNLNVEDTKVNRVFYVLLDARADGLREMQGGDVDRRKLSLFRKGVERTVISYCAEEIHALHQV